MISRKYLVSVLAFSLVVAALVIGSTALAEKKKKDDRRYGPPSLSLAADPTVLRICEETKVQLVATARSPEGGPLRYKWTTNGGRLIGDGANTTWDLSGARAGVYQAVVEVDNGRDLDCVAFSTATVVVIDCPPPPPPPPVCPTVSVSCPDALAEDQPVTFSATVAGGSANVVPSYQWTVSAGRIIRGQGTPSITVDISGLAGQTIRADLDVGGYNTPCPASCATSVPIPNKPRKFDVYPDIAFNDEKARLDNFAIQLQSEPGAKGYIIVHPARNARPGVAQRRAQRAADYLINTRGLDASRVATTVEAVSDEWIFELWIVPEGARLPIP
jgi:PKD-like domain